jgi:hypothetical protein
MLAGVIGSALGFWLWQRQRMNRERSGWSERGTVIFDNTPRAASEAI